MTVRVHCIIEPAPLTIFDELIDLIETAETAEGDGHHVEALLVLSNVQSKIKAHLAGEAH